MGCDHNRPKIVVDASVARAAGGFDATHEVSVRCRDVLLCMYHNRMNLVWIPPIIEEWKSHTSNFTISWKTNMARANLICIINPHQEMPVLWKEIEICCTSASSLETMKKDFMLIEAAIGTGKRIISGDDRAREEYAAISSSVKDVSILMWVNPANRNHHIFEWMHRDVPFEIQLTLGF